MGRRGREKKRFPRIGKRSGKDTEEDAGEQKKAWKQRVKRRKDLGGKKYMLPAIHTL
jgi:hypothetical protein